MLEHRLGVEIRDQERYVVTLAAINRGSHSRGRQTSPLQVSAGV